MSDFPKSVNICEEGPREGFQSEPNMVPTADKIRFIEALAETGVREINCVSFVNPKRVPQMADAEAVAAGIRKRPGVHYTGTILNAAGFDRARKTPLDCLPLLFLSASETFGIRNSNKNRTEALAEQQELLSLYQAAGFTPRDGYVFTAFGCAYESDIAPSTVVRAVSELLELFKGLPVPRIVLCDTVGWAHPLSVERLVGSLRERWPELRLGLHLHDTRGLGIANAMAGLRLGVDHFDSSCGGLGGCPFAGNTAAAGNIATEELVQMCEEMGISTGIDLERLIECVAMAEEIVGHPLPSKVAHAGSLAARRKRNAQIALSAN
ncbi:hydroxymethylglutaryl-CoA lyase [Ottowia thiooxydans]|uniref:hydroxymethylglutaryl-CoA lyase n=1 Tax=Ottowia thiooxydans TaxID=219182 RepID=UPI000409B216|nr:hydroxymethylglutaryl-CoA lyase [Ottowia thiooxydans]